MAMPRRLVMVRHAESEANLVQRQFKQNADAVAPDGFRDRHDAHMRLSAFGREVQAPMTGAWLRREFPRGFDRYVASPLARTRETAGRLALGGEWRLDDRWREQDWGEYSGLNNAEQERLYAISARLRNMHRWYWCIPGGESYATGVRLRVESALGTLHREMPDKDVVVVTHGGTFGVGRFILERMDPDQWLEEERSPARKVENCQTIDYSKVEPGDTTGAAAPQFRWMRCVCPWDETRSWEGGEWMEIPRRRTYSDAELLESVERHARLFQAGE